MRACCIPLVTAAVLLTAATEVRSQTLTVYVWLDDREGPVKKSTAATVQVTPSIRMGVGGNYKQTLKRVDDTNKYALQLQGAPASIDVGVDQLGYYSLPIFDLSGDKDYTIHVRLLDRRYPLSAPECFAIKTQYEFLFRKEQQSAGNPTRRKDREKVEARARLKYADGLLVLPNPNRPLKVQPERTRAMLDRMKQNDPDGYDDLEGMMDGLFDLYKMDGFKQFVPSRWKTTYWTPEDKPVDATVELFGTSGTYKTGTDTHELENVDIVESDDGYVIRGDFRYMPRTPREARGTFNWLVEEGEGGPSSGTPASARTANPPGSGHW